MFNGKIINLQRVEVYSLEFNADEADIQAALKEFYKNQKI
jgi:hypothetical protein